MDRGEVGPHSSFDLHFALTMRDGESFFMCLLATSISCCEKYLFMSFPYFDYFFFLWSYQLQSWQFWNPSPASGCDLDEVPMSGEWKVLNRLEQQHYSLCLFSQEVSCISAFFFFPSTWASFFSLYAPGRKSCSKARSGELRPVDWCRVSSGGEPSWPPGLRICLCPCVGFSNLCGLQTIDGQTTCAGFEWGH